LSLLELSDELLSVLYLEGAIGHEDVLMLTVLVPFASGCPRRSRSGLPLRGRAQSLRGLALVVGRAKGPGPSGRVDRCSRIGQCGRTGPGPAPRRERGIQNSWAAVEDFVRQPNAEEYTGSPGQAGR
jgi:hypothetical protein